MSYKSHSLNLWNPSGTSKLDIDALDDKIHITTTGGQNIQIDPVVKIGSIDDVEQKFIDTDSAIASGNAGAAAASALVQQNLDAYVSSNNSTVATMNSTIISNKAITDAGQVQDAQDRATMNATLGGLITAEETARISDVASLTSNLNTEISDRQTAISSEQTARASDIATVNASINVQKGRIDDLLSESTLDLDTLSEIVTTFANVDSNTLGDISQMKSQLNELISRVNALTSSSDDDVVLGLASVIAGVELDSSNSAFLASKFFMNFNMLDQYSNASSGMLGESVYKSLVIAASSGALTGSSSQSEYEAYLLSVLNATYASTVISGSTLENYKLKYIDPEHYCLETSLPSGSKNYFKGQSQSSLPDVDWRLSYCSTAGDKNSIYTTVASGTQQGNTLTIVPNYDNVGIWKPVSGVNNAYDGFKSSLLSLTLG